LRLYETAHRTQRRHDEPLLPAENSGVGVRARRLRGHRTSVVCPQTTKIAGEPILGDTAEGRSQIEALIREDTDFLPRHGPFTESALGRSEAPRPLNATKAEIVPRAAFVRSLYSPGLLVEVRAAKRTKTNRRWGKGTESGD
jgi:hypothetical protein